MKQTPNHKLRYPESTDPDTLAAYYKNIADDTERELDAIAVSQLVVPNGAEDAGKILVVQNTGALAYKAMGGDGTIDKDGNFQLGAGVVGTDELANKGVTGAKVDNGTLGPEKFTAPVVAALSDERTPKANSVNSSKVVDGSLTDADLASPNNAAYRSLFEASGIFQEGSAGIGTYYLGTGTFAYVSGSDTGGAGSFPIPIFHLQASRYAVAGKTLKLNLAANLACNNVVGKGAIEVSLHPVTIGAPGFEGRIKVNLGAAKATATFNAPAANAVASAESGDVAVPADGAYALGVTYGSTQTAKNLMLISAALMMRHV